MVVYPRSVWHSVDMSLPPFDPKALYFARLAKGWSRARLAEASGVSDETIRRAEIGRFAPRPDTLSLLAAALELSPIDLLDDAA